ncbi:hypothetical protein P7K49_033695 [Saguinus oedipus]|uniref:Transmembrane protein 161A n=1 Tax=Saguinus oedipus TaxID=9490 RepID=A0ABQ9TTQ5_SAGOE|nr:hypothetical protein P7K49_033695 [Saguinus oedipus]
MVSERLAKWGVLQGRGPAEAVQAELLREWGLFLGIGGSEGYGCTLKAASLSGGPALGAGPPRESAGVVPRGLEVPKRPAWAERGDVKLEGPCLGPPLRRGAGDDPEGRELKARIVESGASSQAEVRDARGLGWRCRYAEVVMGWLIGWLKSWQVTDRGKSYQGEGESEKRIRDAVAFLGGSAECRRRWESLSLNAVLGVQLVVTLLTATLMHRLAPHCSFARWLLCNGSLFRYKHPSEEELRALAGKPRPRGRKERWADGLSEEKPLSVPRDAPFQLETCPLTTVDALVLRFFLEYQWFVDFAVYSGGVYLFTEAYYYVLGPAKETNIAVFWCLLTVAFSIKAFLMVTRLYFSSEEGGERSVCLTFAFLFLLLAMLVQVVREETLELGLEPGLASMTQNLEPLLKKQGWDWVLPVAKLAIRVGLAVVGSVLGAFLTFPGLRLAQTHRDALTMSEDRPMLQLNSWRSLGKILGDRELPSYSPCPRPTQHRLSDSAFDSGRLWLLVVLCLLRLAVTRPHLQAYLCLAKARVEQLRREAGRIEAREIQRRVVRVYCYVTVVSLQYLTPLILTLNCTLLLKTLGGYSWGLGPAPLLSADPSSASSVPIGPEEDEVQQTAARIAAALGGLLTPLFLRGVLAYLIWWTAACQLLSSLFGLYFHQHLAGS